MAGTLLLAGVTAGCVGAGAWEYLTHRRRLARIPIRVHVNGTRGKSTVTRLIAAGLRAGGIRTCAKTTGTLPRMSFCDGSEYPVFRPGKANVIEQIRIVRAAVADSAEALVIECMALRPELQSLCELKLVQSTHGVITNARADHLDCMGPTTRDVALALAGSTPKCGTLYTAERELDDVFRASARERKSRFVPVSLGEVQAVTRAELQMFGWIEHAENVALALRVCSDLGVDRAAALEGMWRMTPDFGVMTVHQLSKSVGEYLFVNGFAANDPVSTGCNWQLAIDRFPHAAQRVAVVNCRCDRPERSVQLGHACASWWPADRYLVVGGETRLFAKSAVEAGVNPLRIRCLEAANLETILEELQSLSAPTALVVGMGNIDGPGKQLARHAARHGRLYRESAARAEAA